MVVVTDLIRIEADLYLKFLLGLHNTSRLGYLENTILLYLGVIELPSNIMIVNILNEDSDELGVASVRFCDDFSFEIDDGRLENELGLDGLAENGRIVVDLDRVFDEHGDGDFIVACFLGVKLDFKSVDFLWFDDELEFTILILVFLNNLLLL